MSKREMFVIRPELCDCNSPNGHKLWCGMVRDAARQTGLLAGLPEVALDLAP